LSKSVHFCVTFQNIHVKLFSKFINIINNNSLTFWDIYQYFKTFNWNFDDLLQHYQTLERPHFQHFSHILQHFVDITTNIIPIKNILQYSSTLFISFINMLIVFYNIVINISNLNYVVLPVVLHTGRNRPVVSASGKYCIQYTIAKNNIYHNTGHSINTLWHHIFQHFTLIHDIASNSIKLYHYTLKIVHANMTECYYKTSYRLRWYLITSHNII
jgi:hypothetical protein